MAQLWRRLFDELAGVFDAHFVCAAVASEVAMQLGRTVVVGISDPQRQHYDAWISSSDGDMQQKRWDIHKSGLEALIDAGQVSRIEKYGRPVSELVSSELWLLPQEQILIAPLPYPPGPHPITPPGFICIIDPAQHSFLDEPQMAYLVSSLTIFLDRAYLRHQVDRQEVEFAVISDISHTLTSTLSLEHVFKQLTGTVRRTLNVESLSVGLREPTTGDIIFVDSLMGPRFKDLPPIRLKRGQGIAGWVAENGEPVIIKDAYSDKRFFTDVDRRSGFTTQSMICIPLQVEERTIGILQAINRQNGDFTRHDLRLLQAIGGPLAAAIENARLHTDVLAEKRRIETLFTSMAEGVITVNAEGYITQVNEAMSALVLTEPDTLIGAKAQSAIRLRSGNLGSFIATVMEAHDEYPQMTADLMQNGSSQLPVLISGAAIRDEEGASNEMILAFSDLRQIREVERMRDDLFHGIVHELRTPLATILMYARLLREGKARDEEKAARFLGVIERESDRLQKMVRQMLQLAKQEARELQRSPEPVDLNEILEELLPPLADQATEKGLLFRQQIEPKLPPVLGNPETMELIIKNLVDNAIKFTPSGTVRIDACVEGTTVRVDVKDQGIGIPRQALPNMFKRFYRTQTAVERGIAGTGLGLYMVKESIENYNGTITIDSVEGKGTTFTVRLPIDHL